ncbi:site-specific integrase [Desulfosporosinus burensis]
MASIKKRPNGTYQATIFVGRDSDGKQLFQYVTKPGLRECKAAAREIEQEIEDKTFVNVANVKLTVWIEKWLELNKERLSPSTNALYKTYLKNHYEPFFGVLKLGKINEIKIKEFINLKLKTLSQSSVRRMTSALKVMLHDAMKGKSPARDVKLPLEEKYTPRVLTEKEMQQIHDVVKGTRDEPIILIAAWCGLRRGEVFALKWNDLDWEKGTLRVDESYCINDDNLYEDKRPKSENGIRVVAVPEYLMNLLEQLRKSKFGKIEPIKKVKVVEPDQPKNEGDHRIFNIRPDNYSSYFAEFIRDNNLPVIRFHDLRHYHASWLYARGIPDQYAAQRLGHDIAILKSIYQHLGLDKQIEIDDSIRQMHKEKDTKKETRLTSD